MDKIFLKTDDISITLHYNIKRKKVAKLLTKTIFVNKVHKTLITWPTTIFFDFNVIFTNKLHRFFLVEIYDFEIKPISFRNKKIRKLRRTIDSTLKFKLHALKRFFKFFVCDDSRRVSTLFLKNIGLFLKLRNSDKKNRRKIFKKAFCR